MKYLLQAIDARRDCVRLSDHELRDLLIEVRSGKDDRIEFTESMVRLLDELKSSEHAAAFLSKVAKRDAPDYYDVIKNPMDLGTMMRNVRQARYKSKAQFMRDLDLIWDNCLTYNSEPTHPLRRSVQMLRAKANHLLTYVNDTNDVKEALNQWQASLGLQRRPSESLEGSRTIAAGAASEQTAGSAAGRDRMGSGAFVRIGGGGSVGSTADMIETPFEQQPALLRNTDGMSAFSRLDASLTALDEDFTRRYMSTGVGPSSRPLDSSVEQSLSAVAALDMLKTLEGPQGGMLRRALTTPPQHDNVSNGVTTNGVAPHDGDETHSIPYPLESDDAEREARMPYDAGAAWWNGMAHPSLLAAGVMPLASSEVTANKRIRMVGGRPGKRRRKHDDAADGVMGEDDKAQHSTFGGVDALESNVRTIGRLRRTHTKYGRLNSHIESGEPIPADLGVISSDDDSGDESDNFGTDAALAQAHNPAPKVRRKAPDALAMPIHDLAGNPFAKLGGERAYDMLQSKTNVLLAHTGFDGSQKAAADVLADVAGEFLMNVGRTLRNYTDRFAHEMSVEDLVLHTLYENGGLDVRRLESYVVDDVLRYGNKMSDLLRKLRASYRDTLANSDLTMADEAAYFGAETQAERTAGQGMQSGGTDVDGGDAHILRGGYARELADEDFFGFKDLGLDAELGIDVGRQLASMPSRMFSRTGNEGAAGAAGAAGGVGAKHRIGGSGESGRSMLEFEPPPAFVPLSEAAVAAQIAILRPFYRELMRTRGQWQRIGGEEEAPSAVTTNALGGGGGEGEGDRTDADDHKNAYVILPDEEQERQRYKVPPTGKMPRRAMKQRSSATQQSSTAASSAGGATSNGKSANAQSVARKSAAQQSSSQAKSNGAGAKSKSKSNSGGGSRKKDTGSGSNGIASKQPNVVTVS